jgi:hypothetical protein
MYSISSIEGKRPHGRSRRRWEDDIRMGLREMERLVLDQIHLAKDTDQWRVLISSVMNLWVP